MDYSTLNHLDVVQRVREQEKPTGEAASNLKFLLALLKALPPLEGAGLLRKDAGENIGWYEPAGVNVSMSRICYPDGYLRKVLTDAGPGGQNGAGWGEDGFVDPNRYISPAATPGQPQEGPQEAPGDPIIAAIDLSPIQDQIDAWKAANAVQEVDIESLKGGLEALSRGLSQLKDQIDLLAARVYAQEVKRYKVTGTTEASLYHNHKVNLLVSEVK